MWTIAIVYEKVRGVEGLKIPGERFRLAGAIGEAAAVVIAGLQSGQRGDAPELQHFIGRGRGRDDFHRFHRELGVLRGQFRQVPTIGGGCCQSFTHTVRQSGGIDLSDVDGQTLPAHSVGGVRNLRVVAEGHERPPGQHAEDE